MIRVLLVLITLAGTAGAVVAYGDSDRIARAGHKVSHICRGQTASPAPAVQIPRGQGGEFTLRAKINGVTAPMVIDTGAKLSESWVRPFGSPKRPIPTVIGPPATVSARVPSAGL